MTAAIEQINQITLACEWQRVEQLCQYLSLLQQGDSLTSNDYAQLETLQAQCEAYRVSPDSAWQNMPLHKLPTLAVDVLACIYAAEASPIVGLHYANIQAKLGLNSHPYVSAALIQQLLALNEQEWVQTQLWLRKDGELVKRGLVDPIANNHDAIQPRQAVVQQLLFGKAPKLDIPGAQWVEVNIASIPLQLPDDKQQMLGEFVAMIAHRDTVFNEWQGEPTGGPVALFSGPSGTGKTHAALTVARQLGWPLYRVDLARLVSKYIGETEKNLNALFDAAHQQKLVLLFDEADALLSKRGEVRDARDRYANLEMSYLLSRIESHCGPCILTTNLRNHIDTAFHRRIHTVIEFPRPDQGARQRMWQSMLPRRAPLCENLDLSKVSQSVNLTGGQIRNAALSSAFLAAKSASPIGMSHIAVGVYRELGKVNQQVSFRDLGGLVEFLPAWIVDGQSIDKQGSASDDK